jgi:hypothetical protein
MQANLDPELAQLGCLNVEFERRETEDASQNILPELPRILSQLLNFQSDKP